MSAIKLLECPFCGSEPLESRIEPHKHHIVAMPDYPGAWVIECVKCDYHMIDHDSEDAVIERWNTRIDALLKTGGRELEYDEILVAIKRPEGYEDVHPEIMADDCFKDSAFEYRVISLPHLPEEK